MPSDDPPAPRPGPPQPQRWPRPPVAASTAHNSIIERRPSPDVERVLARLEELPNVRDETKRCVANLLGYRAKVRMGASAGVRLPRGQSAAVLVPLFVGRSGDLYVLLSRRSDALRAFSGDTALPGGKIDAQDVTVEDAARREAFEEVGLPLDKERVLLLCIMEPHLAKGEMVVTPVVVLILDNGLQPNLNSSEVTSIFAQPLSSFLSSTPHGRTVNANNPYHTFTDIPWGDSGTVRLHRFLTGREREGVKPVFGLTASILIKTATIGYGRPAEFEVQPPNAPTLAQQITRALLTPTNPLRVACEQEGIDAEQAVAQLSRPPMASDVARMVEWQKIGMDWLKLMEGDDDAAQAGAEVGEVKKFGPGLRPGVWGGEGSKGLQKWEGGGVAKGNGGDTEGLKAKTEEQTEGRGKERSEYGGEHQDGGTADMEQVGEVLDKTRDMLSERMKELKGDPEKLAIARKVYPQIAEQIKRQLEGDHNGNGGFDVQALIAMILKMSQGGLRGGVEADEGAEEERSDAGDGEGKDRDIEKGKEDSHRSLEETRKYASKGGDSHKGEQTTQRKTRIAKL